MLLKEIVSTNDFPPNADQIVRVWASKGLHIYGQMFGEREIKSFEQLSSQNGLSNSHLFRYFQVRSDLSNTCGKRSIHKNINPLIKCLLNMYDCGVETK